MCQGENLRVHVMGNILNLKKPKSVFRSWKRCQVTKQKRPVTISMITNPSVYRGKLNRYHLSLDQRMHLDFLVEGLVIV